LRSWHLARDRAEIDGLSCVVIEGIGRRSNGAAWKHVQIWIAEQDSLIRHVVEDFVQDEADKTAQAAVFECLRPKCPIRQEVGTFEGRAHTFQNLYMRRCRQLRRAHHHLECVSSNAAIGIAFAGHGLRSADEHDERAPERPPILGQSLLLTTARSSRLVWLPDARVGRPEHATHHGRDREVEWGPRGCWLRLFRVRPPDPSHGARSGLEGVVRPGAPSDFRAFPLCRARCDRRDAYRGQDGLRGGESDLPCGSVPGFLIGLGAGMVAAVAVDASVFSWESRPATTNSQPKGGAFGPSVVPTITLVHDDRNRFSATAIGIEGTL
jgi:hypothetical protein